jgi:hypothetical protein
MPCSRDQDRNSVIQDDGVRMFVGRDLEADLWIEGGVDGETFRLQQVVNVSTTLWSSPTVRTAWSVCEVMGARSSVSDDGPA